MTSPQSEASWLSLSALRIVKAELNEKQLHECWRRGDVVAVRFKTWADVYNGVAVAVNDYDTTEESLVDEAAEGDSRGAVATWKKLAKRFLKPTAADAAAMIELNWNNVAISTHVERSTMGKAKAYCPDATFSRSCWEAGFLYIVASVYTDGAFVQLKDMFCDNLLEFNTSIFELGCFTCAWVALAVKDTGSDEESDATEVADFDDDVPDELRLLHGSPGVVRARTVDEIIQTCLRRQQVEEILICLLRIRDTSNRMLRRADLWRHVTAPNITKLLVEKGHLPLIRILVGNGVVKCEDKNNGFSQDDAFLATLCLVGYTYNSRSLMHCVTFLLSRSQDAREILQRLPVFYEFLTRALLRSDCHKLLALMSNPTLHGMTFWQHLAKSFEKSDTAMQKLAARCIAFDRNATLLATSLTKHLQRPFTERLLLCEEDVAARFKQAGQDDNNEDGGPARPFLVLLLQDCICWPERRDVIGFWRKMAGVAATAPANRVLREKALRHLLYQNPAKEASVCVKHQCQACGRQAEHLLECVCRSAYFCDKRCQKENWSNHKGYCREMRHSGDTAKLGAEVKKCIDSLRHEFAKRRTQALASRFEDEVITKTHLVECARNPVLNSEQVVHPVAKLLRQEIEEANAQAARLKRERKATLQLKKDANGASARAEHVAPVQRETLEQTHPNSRRQDRRTKRNKISQEKQACRARQVAEDEARDMARLRELVGDRQSLHDGAGDLNQLNSLKALQRALRRSDSTHNERTVEKQAQEHAIAKSLFC